MTATTAIPLIVVAAYLVGSIPFGWIIAKLVAGIDIRQAGSGNIGATNVARVVGGRWGIVVLVLDMLKGTLPVLLLPAAFLASDHPAFGHARVACGLATILGHNFPCWLGFRGGKGVATSLGVISVLGPVASITAATTFIVAFGLWRIVSLASILAAIAFGVCQSAVMGREAHIADDARQYWIQHWSLAAFCLIGPLLLIVRHRTNIVRLWRGQEPKFRARSEAKPEENESSKH